MFEVEIIVNSNVVHTKESLAQRVLLEVHAPAPITDDFDTSSLYVLGDKHMFSE